MLNWWRISGEFGGWLMVNERLFDAEIMVSWWLPMVNWSISIFSNGLLTITCYLLFINEPCFSLTIVKEESRSLIHSTWLVTAENGENDPSFQPLLSHCFSPLLSHWQKNHSNRGDFVRESRSRAKNIRTGRNGDTKKPKGFPVKQGNYMGITG